MTASIRSLPLLALAAATLLLAGCDSKTGLRLEGRHQTTREAWRDPDGSDKPFREYMESAADAQGNPWWVIRGESMEDRARRIRLITPHEWTPAAPGCRNVPPEGVLLVHGLTDTPFLMRDVGDAVSRMAGRCFLIRSILLPGHGTAPGDLLNVTFTQWQAAFRYGVRSFQDSVSQLHLVGFSTGAALALQGALADSLPGPRIASVIVLSPAVRVHRLLPRIPLLPDLYAWLARFGEQTQWLDVDPDQDFAKYESLPVNAVYQIIRLTRELNVDRTRPVSVPVLMVLAAEDQTVDADAALEFFKTRTRGKSRLILYARPEVRGTYEVKTRALRDRTTIVAGDLSHVATPVARNNPHYGAGEGTYKNCLHYLETGNRSKYCACLPPTQVPAFCPAGSGTANVPEGEITKVNLAKHPLFRRLTYNPSFDDLARAMEQFLSAVPPPSTGRGR